MFKINPIWSNPNKPERLYGRCDHALIEGSPHNIQSMIPCYLYLYNFQSKTTVYLKLLCYRL